jgi:type I restriction enzyme, S subunit
VTANWAIAKLGDVLTSVAREETVDDLKEYRLLGIRLDGRGPFLRETVMGAQTSAGKLFRVADGDFIYSRLFACRGAFGVISPEFDGCYVSGEFPVFVPKDGKIDTDFLKYWFRLPRVIERVNANCTGSTPLTRNRFKENFFLALEIPLPSFAEQRRIVARIEELRDQINEAHTLRHQAAEEAEALVAAEMHQVFRFNKAQTTLGDFAKVQGGFAFASGNYDENGSHQIVRIGNVRDGFLDLSRAPVRWNPSGDARVLRYELKPDDLVISMTGTREKRDYGFIAKVPQNSRLLLNQRVGRFVVYREVDRDYLFHFLRSPFFRDRLFPSATGTANQANIGNGDIEQIKFEPPPLVKQRRIVAELDALQAEMDALKRLQAETAAELHSLLPSILDKAFKGEL